MGAYKSIDALDPTKFTERDKYLLSQAIAEAAASTTLVASEVTYQFPVKTDGFVVAGNTNGFLYRIRVDDDAVDPTNVGNGGQIIHADRYSTASSGDYVFSSGAGPVNYGRQNGSLCRWRVNDANDQNPIVYLQRLSAVSQITSSDYWFAKNFSWVNRGHDQLFWWQWWFDDTDTANPIPLTEPYTP